MIDYILYNNDGVIVQRGHCSEDAIGMIAEANPTLNIRVGYVDNPAKKRVLNGEVVNAPPTPEDELKEIAQTELRRKRDRLLRDSDWSQAGDVPFEPTQRQQWVQYRKALRDLPDQYSDITDISQVQWPQKPE